MYSSCSQKILYVHGTLSWTELMLDHKKSLNTFAKTKIMHIILIEWNEMRNQYHKENIKIYMEIKHQVQSLVWEKSCSMK